MSSTASFSKLLVAAAISFALGVFCEGLSVQAAPQKDDSAGHLEIGGHTVWLGSSRNQVIDKLSADLVLENSGSQVSGADLWFVKPKGEENAIAHVQFRDDLLVAASREWDLVRLDDQTLHFMRAFYSAMRRTFQADQSARVVATMKTDPGTEHFQLDFLASSGRSVTLGFFDSKLSSGDRYQYAVVEETVAFRDRRSGSPLTPPPPVLRLG